MGRLRTKRGLRISVGLGIMATTFWMLSIAWSLFSHHACQGCDRMVIRAGAMITNAGWQVCFYVGLPSGCWFLAGVPCGKRAISHLRKGDKIMQQAGSVEADTIDTASDAMPTSSQAFEAGSGEDSEEEEPRESPSEKSEVADKWHAEDRSQRCSI